jgi:hypothetical protein
VTAPIENDPIQITEGELTSMTQSLKDVHQDTLPRMREALTAWRDDGIEVDENNIVQLTTFSASRRGFLLGAGALLGGIAVVGSGAGVAAANTLRRTGGGVARQAGGQQKLTGDLVVVALAASLENLAVATYQAAIDAATAGKLGAVPPAVVTFAQTAQGQHKDHASAWNAVLTGAGKKAITGVDMTVKTKVVDPAFAEVTDVAGVAKLALELENSAAATYLAAIGIVKSPAGIQTAATIHPVEMQHAAILNFVLGQYPVPDSFAKTDGARSPSDQIG